ncbi:IscS subfamily cysteine desulfurase [Aquibacillus rhizosphaerae]|uniref:IscS subfamily cysteine desulfurase n=1 Tax=Aquibacillus rhizosphaerae TaxID=3051431 RepID=A0ABT7L712_9BACI|nr:IscS subfamily cysteine desulfurase [Aquibacillus sp. LR5S19]MDL4841650.1 IscS subfamily cysteine desulfurase [Aquibacillus sp. LR5S19]
MIYLDYAATTPISDNALHVFNEVSKNYYGNPNSLHDIGTSSKAVLEHCREELAKLVDAPSNGIYFTSGGTESNILAVKTLLRANKRKGKHIITTAMEHSSLYNFFKQLEYEQGYSVSYLAIDKFGQVAIDQLKEIISNDTILASIQHANSELGTIQQLEDIGEILHHNGVFFHSDCVQTFGKIPVNINQLKIDSLSISSHKIYGPKGVGAVYLNPSISWSSDFNNSNQEKGFRAGTVNVAGIAGFVTAAQDICKNIEFEQKRLSNLREYFISKINDLEFKMEIINSKSQLPNIIGILLNRTQGDYAMLEFNRAGIAISTGSACSLGDQQPSRSVMELGKSEAEAKRFIRISLGKSTSQGDIDKAIDICKKVSNNL